MIKKIFKWIGYCFLALIVLGAIVDHNKTPEQKAADAAAKAEKQKQAAVQKQEEAKLEIASLPEVSAYTLARAYNDNSVAADAQFKGKRLKITGTIGDISTDFSGEPYLMLNSPVNPFMRPQAHFDSDFSPQIAKMKKGGKVVIVCTGSGDVAKTPMLRDCMIP